MATGWLKSLHCKSNVVQDVYHHSHQHQKIPLSISQRKKPKPKPKPRKPTNPSKQSTPTKQCSNPHNQRLPKAKPTPTRFLATAPSPFPTLVSLPHGDSSRRVIEIIFTSSWSSSSPFPGVIDMLFKVHNPSVSLALFEAHRSAVRTRAGPTDTRCAVDGNEMMRFHTPQSAMPLEQPVFDAGLLRWCSASGGSGVRTFAGSGGAHDSDDEKTCRRRRAMVVCRVIAGRVGKDPDKGPEVCDSVALAKGELLVFDRSALLPCFLVIYRL